MHPNSKYYYIKSYGCQMSDLDSLQMARLLQGEGYQSTTDPECAQVILINTCSVREKPVQKLYSDIGRMRSLKLQNPEMILGVTGCQAQADGKKLLSHFGYLDLVLGPDQLKKLPELLRELLLKRRQALEVKFESKEDYQFLHLVPQEGESETKAFVSIMKGCDNFCSFCIVPYVRGREVSRDSYDIIQETKHLVQLGVQEVTLLGQNVNSYGNKRGDSVNFSKLLSMIADQTQLKRLRFTTSHPKDLSDALIEQFKVNPILAPHLHLPLQSASDAVLARMYRGYTLKEYLDKLNRLRDANPDVAVTTDIIVGFPGETAADFELTMQLITEVEYDSIYGFVYSPRPKTTAAQYFADDVTQEIKAARLQQVLDLQQSITARKNLARVGKIEEVLVEGPSKLGETVQGRSPHNRIVHFQGGPEWVGKFVSVKITGAQNNSLRGEPITYGR
ncbi:MAG: tRNA (N6-isopentenyl adenosine(37)-C2)-methylthiotransferase MiaB [Deltaproteobacteria bacterium]|nr:tRNA (N6-isopentenyl adenosine(37)-C2)-methylthiotransferase MiaB [Deltaproteobacteria bacterium]